MEDEEEACRRLVEWATSHGAVLNGIAPRRVPERGGYGIMATRALKAKQTILTVPHVLLRTLDSTPSFIKRRLRGATVHGILAAALCLDWSELEVWRAVLPLRHVVFASTPLAWLDSLPSLLPASDVDLLTRQLAKFEADWARVESAFAGNMVRSDFLYAWILVNSRTFYHTTPRTERGLPKEDHMALVPVADLFNHGCHDGSCTVAFDAKAYTFTTSRAYQVGEELFICYGRHSDDVLLVEYGFTLGPDLPNPYDETCLDAHLCPLFSTRQKHRLQHAGFWQRYMLDADTPCYRTLTALRILCLPPTHWAAILDGSRDEDLDRDAVDAQLLALLTTYEKDIRRRLLLVNRLGDEATPHQKACIRARWIAVKNLVLANLSRLRS
ncbi:hypothetical protein XA68_13243 [Ophiocordyceps unilateralis]|uniref:SET domain-containing protein n=1 Tax=Ophiocordyceps unilateralis TaxID=268505 RepID=A0A2A9PMQ4_OPHUN|nr:hypothetical protein XA68_13243 [Ophiocordyceps unilateralis]